MKSLLSKILLSSSIIAYTNSFATPMNHFIQSWKKEGILVFSAPVQYDKLDPTLSLNAHTKVTLPLIFEPLVSIASQQELQPILAKSWHISSDNKSITITLKQRHFFSNNTEVIAQDVVNAIQRVCSPESKVFAEIKGLAGCENHANGKKVLPEVTAIGKYVVKFNINCSPTSFLYQLSSPNLVITKLTKSGLIGSGPYIIHEKKDAYVLLKKNPFAPSENVPKNSGVAIFYANQDDVASILKNDKPDGALMYRMQDIWNFKDDNYRLVKINPNITEILVFNNQRFPFNKPIVRKALAASIYNTFQHSCIPGAHKAYGIIPYGTGGSIDNNAPDSLSNISPQEVFSQVPELKRKRITVIIHQLNDLKKNCETSQIIKTAKQYNIDIKFKYHTNYSTLEPLYLNHNLDGFIELYVFRNREAYSTVQFFTSAGENNANTNDTTLDKLLKEAIATPSSHGRFQMYRRLAQYIQDESIVVPLFYMDHGNILSKCITGLSDNFLFSPFIHIPQLYKIKDCNI